VPNSYPLKVQYYVVM